MRLITFDRLLNWWSLITFYPLTSDPWPQLTMFKCFHTISIQIIRKEFSKITLFDLIPHSSLRRHTIGPLLWPSKAVVCKSESLSTAYNCGPLPRSLTRTPRILQVKKNMTFLNWQLSQHKVPTGLFCLFRGGRRSVKSALLVCFHVMRLAGLSLNMLHNRGGIQALNKTSCSTDLC